MKKKSKDEYLKFIEGVLLQASKSIEDESITNSECSTGGLGNILDKIVMSEGFSITTAGLGAATGGAIGISLLSSLGYAGLNAAGITSGLAVAGSLVGGGMVAGIGVLAAPAVALACGGYAITSKLSTKTWEQKKKITMMQVKLAIEKIEWKIMKEKDADASKARLEHLSPLLNLLRGIEHSLL